MAELKALNTLSLASKQTEQDKKQQEELSEFSSEFLKALSIINVLSRRSSLTEAEASDMQKANAFVEKSKRDGPALAKSLLMLSESDVTQSDYENGFMESHVKDGSYDWNTIEGLHESGVRRESLIYRTFDPEAALQIVKSWNEPVSTLIGASAVAITVGRFTTKKMIAVPILSGTNLNEEEKKVNAFLKHFLGGKKRDNLTFSQVISVVVAYYPFRVLSHKAVKAYMNGGSHSEVYAQADMVFSFDFAGWLPLTQHEVEWHLAFRCLRAVTKSGYIPPDPSVTLSQVNFAHKIAGGNMIELDLNAVQLKFDEIAKRFAPNFSKMPVDVWLKYSNQNPRQADALLTSEANESRIVKSDRYHAAMKKPP